MTAQSLIDTQARRLVRQHWDGDDTDGTRDAAYDRLFSYLIEGEENEDVPAADLSDVASEAVNGAFRVVLEEKLDEVYGR